MYNINQICGIIFKYSRDILQLDTDRLHTTEKRKKSLS